MSGKIIHCVECGISVKSDGVERAVLLLPCQHMIHVGCLEFIQRRTRMQEILLRVTSLIEEEFDKDANGEELHESKMQELLFTMPNEMQYSQIVCPACKTIVYRSIPLFTLSESVKRACSLSQESNTLDRRNVRGQDSVECTDNSVSNEEEAFTQVREIQHRYLHQLHHLFKRRRVVAELGQCCATRHEQRTTLLRELDRYHVELPNLLQEYNSQGNNDHLHVNGRMNDNNEHRSFVSHMKCKEGKNVSSTQIDLNDCNNPLSSLSMSKMSMSELELLLAQSTPHLIETQQELRIERNTLRRRRRKLDAIKKRYQKLKNCSVSRTPTLSCSLENKLSLMTQKSVQSTTMTRSTFLSMQPHEKEKEFKEVALNSSLSSNDKIEKLINEEAKTSVHKVSITDSSIANFRSTQYVLPSSSSKETNTECNICEHLNNNHCETCACLESELPSSERLTECVDTESCLQHNRKINKTADLITINTDNTVHFCDEKEQNGMCQFSLEECSCEQKKFSSSHNQRVRLEEVKKSTKNFTLEEYSSEHHQDMTVIDVDDECDSIIVHDISDDGSNEYNDDENFYHYYEQDNEVEKQNEHTIPILDEHNMMSITPITSVTNNDHPHYKHLTVCPQTDRIINKPDNILTKNYDLHKTIDGSNEVNREQHNEQEHEQMEEERIRRSCNSNEKYWQTKQSETNIHCSSSPSSRVLNTVLQNLPRREDRLWQPSIHFF